MKMKDIAELERVGVALRNTKRWTFTDDEKVILRNLADGYDWIVRDRDGRLNVYSSKPFKQKVEWSCDNGASYELMLYEHLFKSIKWEDEEPCEFRKYL